MGTTKNLYRAEIVSNQSIMDDVIELIETEIPQIEYTLMTNVQGKGISTKKNGATIWPEMNFILFAYTDEANAKKIKAIMETLKVKFPNEGISYFFTKGEEI